MIPQTPLNLLLINVVVFGVMFVWGFFNWRREDRAKQRQAFMKVVRDWSQSFEQNGFVLKEVECRPELRTYYGRGRAVWVRPSDGEQRVLEMERG